MDSGSASKHNLKVAIRIRPMLPREIEQGYESTRLSVPNKKEVVLKIDAESKQKKSFKFDKVFGTEATQDDVFEGARISQLVSRVTDGYHATIFAYGQTGSGKTFTMEGYDYKSKNDGRSKSKAPVIKDNDNIGVTQRAVRDLFQQIKLKKEKTGVHISVFVSYLQIYSEKVYDLLNLNNLNPKKNTKGLRIRWNKKDQFLVENLFIFECKTEEEIMELFHFGLKNKIVASHNLNSASSRSHAIFTITCESVDPANEENVVTSKLQLVDLAGSERISLTGTKGLAAKESIDINKSLFVLRKVIMSLSESNKSSKDKSHIPYRDSKLTSLLKQSIGGNSYCLMIACIAPSDRFLEENVSTLNYATRASNIK